MLTRTATALHRPMIRAAVRAARPAAAAVAALPARRAFKIAAAVRTATPAAATVNPNNPNAHKLAPELAPETTKLASALKASLDKQADSGAGSKLAVPSQVPGTINVLIAGEAAPISEPSVKRPDGDWTLTHPLWKDTYVHQVAYTHLPPQTTVDKLALWTIRAIRFNFDWMSGYSFGQLTERKALTRIVFLETVAGVPGSVASTLRHLASLRRMKRDGGWINSLMAEAENERMHLLTYLQVRQPGPFMRAMVFLTQGLFFNFFWVSYLLSPRFCHRLVGYLEEEAVVTYTHILKSIEQGELKNWAKMPAPEIAVKYWSLPKDATMRDVCIHVRADEAHHRDVNHTLASLNEGDLNPFRDGHA